MSGRCCRPIPAGLACGGLCLEAAGLSQRGSAGEIELRYVRSRPGRRLRLQTQVGEDLLGDRLLEDGRDDLQLTPKLPAAGDSNWPTV
jgi:hypothetical protein